MAVCCILAVGFQAHNGNSGCQLAFHALDLNYLDRHATSTGATAFVVVSAFDIRSQMGDFLIPRDHFEEGDSL